MGLHLLMFSIHCNHAMQPLNVAIFKPLTGAFLVYHNVLMLRKNGIYLLDPTAMEGSMEPLVAYKTSMARYKATKCALKRHYQKLWL